MKVKVDQDKCIGCRACVATAPELFDIDEEGLSYALHEKVEDDAIEQAKLAADVCPTGAIEVEEKDEETK